MSLNLTRTQYGTTNAPTRERAPEAAAPEQRIGRDGKPFIPAEIFMNFGNTSSTTLEDGTEEKIFIALPKGLPLDTMERIARGRDEAANERRDAQNYLLDYYKSMVADMKPGERRYGVIEVEFYRVGELKAAPDISKNKLIENLEFLQKAG
jgi:hypothetical protein